MNYEQKEHLLKVLAFLEAADAFYVVGDNGRQLIDRDRLSFYPINEENDTATVIIIFDEDGAEVGGITQLDLMQAVIRQPCQSVTLPSSASVQVLAPRQLTVPTAERIEVARKERNRDADPDLSIDGQDLEGRHVLLHVDVLRAEYRSFAHRVVRATSGFGCSPSATGRAVYCEDLFGDSTRYNRSQIKRFAHDSEVIAAEDEVQRLTKLADHVPSH